MIRGSRKHILDWTEQADFPSSIIKLVHPVEVQVPSTACWMPRGYGAAAEARLETFGPKGIKSDAWQSLRLWWLRQSRGANTPNWDLAVACEIEGRPGLVLVEAKANVPELSTAGKPFRETGSRASRGNHDQIGRAIEEACVALRRLEGGVAISRDSHYQLANRLAFAWKLATLGVPTVLVYLGFTGDSGIFDAGEPFKDEAHWKAALSEYTSQRVPAVLFERRLDCGPAPAWFLVRSRPVLNVSSPRRARTVREARRS